MKIFVCEFITGGGLYREAVPASLLIEGTYMRDALLRDLSALPNIELILTYDARLLPPSDDAIAIDERFNVWLVWQQCIAKADAVWLIAPEMDGVLLKLTALVEAAHKVLLGCGTEAVSLTTSKSATYHALCMANIATVPTYQLQHPPQLKIGAWVAKRDDGAGCDDSAYFDSYDLMPAWLKDGREHSHIIQPYQHGIAASISMLCKQGRAMLLSCNLQKIAIEQHHFVYQGSIVNGMVTHWNTFEHITKQVAQAMPFLSGYVGVDVIVKNDDQVLVLEINPRLTTSYVGLHESIEHNPAKLVIDLLYNDKMPTDIKLACHQVEISLIHDS